MTYYYNQCPSVPPLAADQLPLGTDGGASQSVAGETNQDASGGCPRDSQATKYLATVRVSYMICPSENFVKYDT